MKTTAIIQTRMTSTRLPGKVLLPLHDKPALQRIVERLRAAKTLDDIIVACTDNPADDPIVVLCEKMGCNYFRGSEDDVLSRVLGAVRHFNVDVIVEVTADCPLLDSHHVDHLVKLFQGGNYDHVSNIIERTFPRGYDIRVFSREALKRADKDADNPIDRQHVSTVMYLNPRHKQNYKCLNWSAPPSQHRPDLQITLDTSADLELIRWIYGYETQGYNMELSCEQVINLLDTYGHLEVCQAAKNVPRKDYFAELEEWYKKHDEGEKKQDGQVQRADHRRGRPRSTSGPAGKRK